MELRLQYIFSSPFFVKNILASRSSSERVAVSDILAISNFLLPHAVIHEQPVSRSVYYSFLIPAYVSRHFTPSHGVPLYGFISSDDQVLNSLRDEMNDVNIRSLVQPII